MFFFFLVSAGKLTDFTGMVYASQLRDHKAYKLCNIIVPTGHMRTIKAQISLHSMQSDKNLLFTYRLDFVEYWLIYFMENVSCVLNRSVLVCRPILI